MGAGRRRRRQFRSVALYEAIRALSALLPALRAEKRSGRRRVRVR